MGRSKYAHAIAIIAIGVGATACGNASTPSHANEAKLAAYAVNGVALIPVVHGSVRGHATYLFVDTGAEIPVVEAKMARDANLELKDEAAKAHDPTGKSIEMKISYAPDFTIDGLGPVSNKPTAVIALPDMFTRGGIGAIFSPQAVATRDTAVVIDLPHGSLWRAPFDDVLREMTNSKNFAAIPDTHFCRYGDNEIEARVLVGSAMFDGVPANVEIDTGADGAMLIKSSAAAKKVETRPWKEESTTDAAGSVQVHAVPNVAISEGAHHSVGLVRVSDGTRDAHCGFEGRIGIRELHGCVLVIGSDDFRVFCKHE